TELRATLRRLRVERADTVLVPSASDLCGPHGAALWERLNFLKDEGLCRNVGVALYASDDPVGVARRFRPDVIQAPASLLHQRLLVNRALDTLADVGLEVHLRSLFLSALLFPAPARVPAEHKRAAGRNRRAADDRR